LIAHVSDTQTYAPRPIQLPAVLQIAGRAPFFGMIASMSEQGLTFDFQTGVPVQQAVGSKAILDFNFLGQHHSCNTLFIHVQGTRALLSLRDATPTVLAALHAVNRHNAPPLASSLSVLQRQHACHARFMDGMKAVVNDFYQRLPGEIEKRGQQTERSGLAHLQARLTQLRPTLTQQFTLAFPMYPEQRASYAASRKPDLSLELVHMDQVDDWIRRTTIAQRIDDAITPLPHEFNRYYNALLKNDYKQLAHPYLPDSVLNALADLIAPLGLDTDQRNFCYELMGQALEKQASTLYPAMIQVLGVVPDDIRPAPNAESSLAKWLETSAQATDAEANRAAATAEQVGELATLLARLTHNLDALGTGQTGAAADPRHAAGPVIPALLAHDRIMARFLPASPSMRDMDNPLFASPESPTAASAFGKTLGGLSGLDDTALEGLRAQLRQPPPIDPGPDKLPETSQVRALMQQAQGLVLQYTLNGLSYQAHPGHPAWILLNELDALHRGADDHGQFLEPALNQATGLAMQWLLAQEDTDAALLQLNALLAQLNTELLSDRRARRAQHLSTLGDATLADAGVQAGWCVIKRDGEAIPHEILGKFGDFYALLNRSATRLLEIPTARFAEEFEGGLIEETASFDAPFLERAASATLTASLDAVHAYTWKDPASGCLKRAALMDELERRLDHPVVEPPTFCALIEIPTMRPGLSSLPGDDLSVMQTRSGELLLEMLGHGEQCGRLSDVSFMIVFSPQDPQRVADRLGQLKAEMEGLHPTWKMIGAVVPLVAPGESAPTPSSVLRRANQACAGVRPLGEFDLSGLLGAPSPPAPGPVEPLPFGALYLRCQKIAPCEGGAPSHYEVLLGLDEALAAVHSTQSFVVMAEKTGRIHELDTWVLQAVFDWMDRNATGLDQLNGLSVNLSGNSLTQTDHVDAMVRLLSDYPHLTKKLIIEVTETAAIDNLDVAVRALRKLRSLGCRVALDDFGSGYSSYSYVRSLPLDYLKIDGTYIRNILTDKTDQALTASMVDVAHALGLKVIAEYVDSEATYSWLRNLGVDYVQGYWVHEPERLDGLTLH
jgi:EAL domain-containing protein (putative c-di-GMP-specific phosphodiesterase class I)